MRRIQSGTRSSRKFKRAKKIISVIKGLFSFANIRALFIIVKPYITIKRLAVAGAFCIVIFSAIYYLTYIDRCEDYHMLMDDIKMRSDEFSGEVGIFIKDMWTGKTIRINSEKMFPSASLVKIPIMAAVFQAEEDGLLEFSDEIMLRWRHKVWAKHGLYKKRVGTKYTTLDLVKRMIITSDNTATNMLVEKLGFGYINRNFVNFGLSNTDLRRGIMELKWRKRGIDNYTTAEDMAFLLEEIYHKRLVTRKASGKMLDILKMQRVNDRIPYLLPDNIDIAHKTGSLRDTISDVGIVFTSKGDFIICVLTLNSQNWKTAKKFIRKIADYTYRFCYM